MNTTRRDTRMDVSEDDRHDELLKVLQYRSALSVEDFEASFSAVAGGENPMVEKKAPPSNEKKDRVATAAPMDENLASVGILVAPGDDECLEKKENVACEEVCREETIGSQPGAFAVAGIGVEETSDKGEESSSLDSVSEEATADPQPALEPLDACVVDDTLTAKVSRSEEFTLDNTSTELYDMEQANPFDEEEDGSPPPSENKVGRIWWLGVAGIIVLLLVAVLLAAAIMGTFFLTRSEEGDASLEPNSLEPKLLNMTTLERIKASKELRCSDVFLPNGFMYQTETGETTGFYGELCHALAAALSVKAVFVPPTIKWAYLQQVASHNQDETVDVSLIGHSITMERVVSGALAGIQEGLSFSQPVLYGGFKIGGDPFHVTQCIDKGLKHIEECSSLKVCISNMTNHYNTLKALMPSRFFHIWNNKGIHDMFDGILNGSCNVVAQGVFFLTPKIAAVHGLTNYSVSKDFFSKESISVVTKSNDPEFSDFVNGVLHALIAAEQHNITQATAYSFPETSLFGVPHKAAFQNALRRVGNYGELYDRFLQDYTPRASLNLLNQGKTGLLSSVPWGNLHVARGDRPLGSTMQSILDKGAVRCGIRTGRPGFAEVLNQKLAGMDVDLCMAVAAGLFQGDANAVEFVEVNEAANGFSRLASGAIDIMAGAVWNIPNDLKEPTTGEGFAFSPPYFYGYSAEEDNFALATRQEDHDWASFVFFTVNALFDAEENGIQSNTSHAMPEQFLFGTNLKRMLRDIVLTTGNYGDMYEKHLEHLYPRSGRNLLNTLPGAGPQHYALQGFFQ